jgi:hypothetical protein
MCPKTITSGCVVARKLFEAECAARSRAKCGSNGAVEIEAAQLALDLQRQRFTHQAACPDCIRLEDAA